MKQERFKAWIVCREGVGEHMQKLFIRSTEYFVRACHRLTSNE